MAKQLRSAHPNPLSASMPVRTRSRSSARRCGCESSRNLLGSAAGAGAAAVRLSDAVPAKYGTFVKYTLQHTDDAILAAPVDTEELVTGEALWVGARTGVYGCVRMLVAMVFELSPSWGMMLVAGV